jgi:endogenous inhibitor of DNA gyrase (YacG/DUF329 family)
MIPLSVSDAIKLLDQIPIWKALRDLPKRVTELEARLKALEERAGQKQLTKAPNALACPICDSVMKVTAENPHSEFGFAGVKVRAVECPSCGHKAHRDFEPAKGYS